MIDGNLGALVLCGGESRRMGRSKAWLRLGPETLLQRVVRRLEEVVGPVLVVAAEGQELPELPESVRVARDRMPHRGPLEALSAGLEAMQGRAEWVYVTGTDSPFLAEGWVQRLADLRPGFELVLPVDTERMHPLSALYQVTPARRAAQAMLAEGDSRMTGLAALLNTRRVEVDSMRVVDPTLDTLKNLNHPADYEQAVLDLGLSLKKFGPREGT